jgi:predicted phosphodiesterase
MSNNHILLYHALFGGRIQDLVDKFGLSKSNIHRILDKAKKEDIYDWTLNKNKEFTKVYIDTYGENVLSDIINFKEVYATHSKEHNSSLNKPKKVMVLPDIHFPDNISLKAIEKFMADYQPDVLIYLGDVLDLRYLSKFDKDNRLILGNKLRKEYNAIMSLMDKHIKLSKADKIYFIEGNHEFRVRKFLESYPAGVGFIEIPIAMKLEERGIKWVEMNDWVRLGKLFFTHGVYYNVYHARKHVDTYQRNMIYGHTHAIQVHSGFHPFDKKLPHVAKSIGCLCDLNPDYMKNRPNQWVNAFYICEIETSGIFSDNIITIVNGEFRIPGMSKRYTNGS